MATATLRCYAELNHYLSPERRQQDVTVPFVPPTPVRHLAETLGIPHTEIELVLLNGETVDLEAPVNDGDRVALYPVFEAFDIQPELRLRARPLRKPRFLADAHLGKLAGYLRLLGFDTLCENDIGDPALVQLAAREQRILLSRDRCLLMHKAVTRGCHLRSSDPREQLRHLVARLQLCELIRPFTRCTVCNAPVQPVAKEAIIAALPDSVARLNDAFWRCSGCGRLYWRGSHWRALSALVASVCGEVPHPETKAQ
jgi:uncharacterized protein with PIN domain